MTINRECTVCCDICERDYEPRLGGLGIDNLLDVKGRGWIVLKDDWLYENKIVCPKCQRLMLEAIARELIRD